MNYVIVKTVRKSRKMFTENNTTTGTATNKGMEARQKSMKFAEKQLTIMLLLVTTLFLILLCPTYIRFIYLSFIQMDTPLKYANSMFFFQVSFKLYTTNSGINFLLYCISGKKFRNDLKEILCFCNFLNRSATRCRNRSESNATENCTVSSFRWLYSSDSKESIEQKIYIKCLIFRSRYGSSRGCGVPRGMEIQGIEYICLPSRLISAMP